MSKKLSYHMQKFKKEAVRGIQSHNQRERKSHSNPDIDYGRTNGNYDLHNQTPINFMTKINERIDLLVLKKALRHDAVYMCEAAVSAGREFFQSLSPEETKRFFQESYNYLAEYVGKENIIAAVVHMDETTPHMHFSHVPVTKDGRLSANSIYSRIALKDLQTNLHAHLASKGFAIERGEPEEQGKAKKHLNTKEFKEQQEALKNLKHEAASAAQELEEVNQNLIENQQKESVLQERVTAYEKQAERAEAILKTKHALPKPNVFNYKSVIDEAMKIIKMQKEALLNKEKIEKYNCLLQDKQKDIDRKIAAIEAKASEEMRNLRELLIMERKNTGEMRKALRQHEAVGKQVEKFLQQPKVQELLREYQKQEKQKQRSFTLGR